MDELAVSENPTARRFELAGPDGVVGFAVYSVDGEVIVIDHVETAPQHRGNGYAARLLSGLLDQLRETGRSVVPVCSYAVAYLRDNPDQHDLLA